MDSWRRLEYEMHCIELWRCGHLNSKTKPFTEKLVLFEVIVAAHMGHSCPDNGLLQARYYNTDNYKERFSSCNCKTEEQFRIPDNDHVI